uniref:Uncharacterized protein n=1 Tax=Mesocestoides corti TaxID=53468 RepID=A0A5K3ERJ9_MESCO
MEAAIVMPHPHPTPDEAATKIQATFRGYNTRKHIHQGNQSCAATPGVPVIVTPYRNDPDLAATKIQASFRGYLTRREFGHLGRHHHRRFTDDDEAEKLCPALAQTRVSPDAGRSLSDISNQSSSDVDDEDLQNRAATRIQAAFRGYHVRSHLPRRERASEGGSPRSVPSPSPLLSEDEAATKIQAAFRGYRVRKNFRAQTAPIHLYVDPKYDEAAKKIQASYRGYRVRKELNQKRHN